MKKNIPLTQASMNKTKLKWLAFITSFLIVQLLFGELTWISLLVVFCWLIAGYCQLKKMQPGRRLEIEDETIFYRDLVAKAELKKTLLRKPCIWVTSNTERGYHRIKIEPYMVSQDNWNELMERCKEA